jgi:hypothetical protein
LALQRAQLLGEKQVLQLLAHRQVPLPSSSRGKKRIGLNSVSIFLCKRII